MPSALPRVPPARRRELLAARPEPELHARALVELGFADALEESPAARPAALSGAIRVVAWNAQRGADVAAAARLLQASQADVLLLSELDVGMARSGQRHTARELAARLGCGFAFAVEFLELGLGDAREQAEHAGQENELGYHGNAILCRAPLVAPKLVRLPPSGDWFDGRRGERRIGSRIALLCRVGVSGHELALASVHLENHADPDERALQLAATFDALERYAPGLPALVGGDVNSHSLSRAELEDRALLRQALARDPKRLRAPERHEPLFALAERRGYDTARCNAAQVPTHRAAPGPASLKLDWLFARGLRCADPAVLPAVDPDSQRTLSDHDAIAVTVRL